MTVTIIMLFVLQIILPATFIFSLLKGKFKGKVDWLLQAILYTVYISWVFFSGNWVWTSYYFRWLWPLLLIVGLYISWQKIRIKPSPTSYTRKIEFAFYIILTTIFIIYHVQVFSGYFLDEQAIELDFPLNDGTFYVGHGGASTAINYHYPHPEQRYALDILQLNALGLRTAGIYPKNLDAYKIYGATLVSPCTGEIIASRANMPDLIPPDTDPEHPEGNYVEIYCEQEDINVFIAHMQENSLTVETGDQVKTGDEIGLVGNTGNTSEPHLHIHAVKDGEGIPIKFDGRFLVRNNLVWQ